MWYTLSSSVKTLNRLFSITLKSVKSSYKWPLGDPRKKNLQSRSSSKRLILFPLSPPVTCTLQPNVPFTVSCVSWTHPSSLLHSEAFWHHIQIRYSQWTVCKHFLLFQSPPSLSWAIMEIRSRFCHEFIILLFHCWSSQQDHSRAFFFPSLRWHRHQDLAARGAKNMLVWRYWSCRLTEGGWDKVR